MKNLKIASTKYTPVVEFNSSTGLLNISGKSLPEDARTFYNPIINWIRQLSGIPLDTIEINIALTYFNSSSTKQLLKILYAIEDLEDLGKVVRVVWHAKKGDEMILEKGKELSQLIDCPFNIQTD